MMRKFYISTILGICFTLASVQLTPTQAQSTNSQYSLQKIVDGLDKTVYVTNAGDDSNRLFVAEKVGRIWIIQDGQLLPTPFLDLSDFVGSISFEQGFFSLAFHPNYAENGWFYVSYSDLWGNIVVAQYSVSPNNPNLADPISVKLVVSVLHSYTSHYGGQLQFGPDGYLYLSVGDNYDNNGKLDPARNSQNPRSFLGKILRLDVNNGLPYQIPADNPYTFQQGWAEEVWAMGFRNPWRFSFDRETGDLYIGDVGHDQWEEVDFQPASSRGGENYGWNDYEGWHSVSNIYNPNVLTFPVMEYEHDENCAVIGGYVYRGQALPGLVGTYVFGDFCSGTIWKAIPSDSPTWQRSFFLQMESKITSFGEDEAGEIYVASFAGKVYQIVAAG